VNIDWSYPGACLWGIGLVVALAGWGFLGQYALALPAFIKPLGLGMASALGTALFIFFSGCLLLMGWFSKTFVAVFLVMGLAMMAVQIVRRQVLVMPAWTKYRSVQIVGVLVAGWLIFLYCAAAANRGYNESDDFPAYFPFVRMMLDTGTFLDPFSVRRLSAFGGHSAMETLTLSFLPWKYGHLLDCGVALLIMVALVYEQVKGNSLWSCLGRFGLVAVAMTCPVPRVNTTSELTTALLMLAFLRSLDLLIHPDTARWKGPLLVAVFAAALATLRAQNFYCVGLLELGYFAFRFWHDKDERNFLFAQAVKTGGATCVFLLPWFALSQLSSDTFLYPLIRGNHQPGINYYGGNFSYFDLLKYVAAFFFLTPFLLYFIPALAIAPRSGRGTAFVLGGGILVTSLVMVIKFTSVDADNLYRYLMPLAFGFFLYAAGAVMRQMTSAAERQGRWVWSPVAAACLLPGILFAFHHPPVRSWLTAIKSAIAPKVELTIFSPVALPPLSEIRGDYENGMSGVPAGTSVLTALDYPFLLNYKTHHLFGIDQPGIASPRPGFPYFQGPVAVKNYLLGHGITYIAQVPFDQSSLCYSARAQEDNLTNDAPPLMREWAFYDLDFMKNVDTLAASNHVIYSSGNIRIIALQ
jgi:hypothetical protein